MGDAMFVVLLLLGVGLLLVAALAWSADLVVTLLNQRRVTDGSSPVVTGTGTPVRTPSPSRAGCPSCGRPAAIFRRSGGRLVCLSCTDDS